MKNIRDFFYLKMFRFFLGEIFFIDLFEYVLFSFRTVIFLYQYNVFLLVLKQLHDGLC